MVMYRKTHPEYVEYQQAYHKNWRRNNQTKIIADRKEYYNKNKEIIKQKQVLISKGKRLHFKGKDIYYHTILRLGICSKCGKKGETVLHHEQYDETDPLKHTIEICRGCHTKEHKIHLFRRFGK